jgi:hypothetical protein
MSNAVYARAARAVLGLAGGLSLLVLAPREAYAQG